MFLIYRWTLFNYYFFNVIKWGHGGLRLVNLESLKCLNIFGTFCVACFACIIVSIHHFDVHRLKQKVPVLLEIYWFVWNKTFFSLLVASVYWILWRKDVTLSLEDVTLHIMSCSVLLLDLLVVKHPSNDKNYFLVEFINTTYGLSLIVFQFLAGHDK